MPTSEHIAGLGNTEVPAYFALKEDGFEITIRCHDPEIWEARKDELVLSGGSPLEILVLWALRSKRGKDWKASDEETARFLKSFYPERNR